MLYNMKDLLSVARQHVTATFAAAFRHADGAQLRFHRDINRVRYLDNLLRQRNVLFERVRRGGSDPSGPWPLAGRGDESDLRRFYLGDD